MIHPAPLDLSRIPWAGLLTVLASVAAVLCIRAVVLSILHPPAQFTPLTLLPPIIDTIIGATGASVVFWVIGRHNVTPIRTFRRVATGILLISFVPVVALAVRHLRGAGWPEAVALMSMHVVVWAICVTMLPRLVTTKNS